MALVEYSLDIVGLSKSFRRKTLARAGYSTIKSALLGGLSSAAKWVSGKSSRETSPHVLTHAIDDLTIRVPRGSSLGIIGRNGSGKSTLLKLITGIYKADRGTVQVNGRIAALIELGAGFHPDFTGRENLMLGGVLHGLSKKQLEARFSDIVEFAELEEVIDDPVRTYSSGMFMRLGFSLAIHTEPDILIIDEVLAVGDAAFTAKCKDRIAQIRREGRTLLLVSHDLDAVERWCDEVVWLNKGKVADRGNPRRVIDHYREHIEKGEEQELLRSDRVAEEERGSMDLVAVGGGPHTNGESRGCSEENTQSARWGSREVEIESAVLLSGGAEEHRVFHPSDGLRVRAQYRVNDASAIDTSRVAFGIAITRSDGVLVFGTNTTLDEVVVPLAPKRGAVEFRVARLDLLDGSYRLDIAVHRDDGYPYDYQQGALHFAVRSAGGQVGMYLPKREWLWENVVGEPAGSPKLDEKHSEQRGGTL